MNKRSMLTAALAMGLLGIAPTGATERIELRGAQLFDNGVTPAHLSVDMSELPPYPEWEPGDPIKEIPQRKGVPRDYFAPITDRQPAGKNRLREINNRVPQRGGGQVFDQPLVNRDGSGFTGVNPPDTVGDVGNDYYIQMINGGGTRVLILDKDDGSTVADFSLRDLAIGSGTGCTSGSGDPIVMFDQTVENGVGEPRGRWFLTEFTGTSFCVYISETADPTTGDWFLYEFTSASGGLPDYPKWAVWPDAYYIGANESVASIPGDGRAVYAFDRENMLQGLTTRPAQMFEVSMIAGFGFQMIHPADWDGRLPPPDGTPTLFVRHRDDEVHNAGSSDPTQDFLEIWEFGVDWDDPNASTFTGPANIGVQDFESELCGLTAFACVPQPRSATKLDPLREPMMWRVQYRNFGDRQVMLGSWVTDVVGGSADIHGVQWAELRNIGSGWQLFQQGVISPDNVNRWMSSIAMDGSGNIAIGYNVSDETDVHPGLRYAGRLVSDPLDTMPRGEFTLVDGNAANSSNRYGDYSSMAVDPVNECTFWFTGEYNVSSQWSTRIGAFRFETCGEPGFVISADPAVGGVCTAEAVDDFVSTLDIIPLAEFVGPVVLSFDMALPAGISGAFIPNPLPPGDTSSATLAIDQSVAPGVFELRVLGEADGLDDSTAALQVTVNDALPGPFLLTAPADGAGNVGPQPRLVWTASSQVETYTIEIATDETFIDIIYTADENGTVHNVDSPLPNSTQLYWRVTPVNFCGAPASSDVRRFTTRPEPGDCPISRAALTVFEDDMEGGKNGWTSEDGGFMNNTWQQITYDAVSGNTAWNAEDLAEQSDQRLISPAIQLPGQAELPLTLRFQNRQEIEAALGDACWDAAILEISTDGGTNWTQLQSEVLFREFDGIVNNFSGGPNPLAGLPAWCGDPRDWEDYVIDLSGFAGEEVRLRFRLGTDGLVGDLKGWTLDDVRVEACSREVLFSDGFESQQPL